MRRVVTSLTALLALAFAAPAQAQDFSVFVPAGVLVMPFDATENMSSFQIVSRIGPSFEGAGIQTHWTYWSADCRHLVDVFIVLTDGDTVAVDAHRVQGQMQTLNPPQNIPVGPEVDLSGERGIVTVTAFAPDGSVSPQLVGGWTIANTATTAAYGADAIGIIDDTVLPDTSLLDEGIFLATFDPNSLTDSQIIVISLEAEDDGVVPIPRPNDALGGSHVCCDVGFIDVLETGFSLPDFCFDCVGFAAVAGDIAGPDEVALIPPSTAATSAGMVHLQNCRSGNLDGSTDRVGEGDFQQFLFAFHGQAVGPFGAAINGKYLEELF